MKDETHKILTILLENVTHSLEESDELQRDLFLTYTDWEKGHHQGREQAYLEFRDWLTQLTLEANASE
jgi:hypothetical protein